MWFYLRNLLSLCNFFGMRRPACGVLKGTVLIWMDGCCSALSGLGRLQLDIHIILKRSDFIYLYFPALLVTNLEVLAGRLDWAAITGCIKRRVRRQTPRISPLEVKIRGFSALRQLGGTPLFSCLAALWCLLGAGGWAGCYRRSPGAAPGPFGWAAEVNLNCDYNVHGEKSRGASDGGWRRWRWRGTNGYNEGGFVG